MKKLTLGVIEWNLITIALLTIHWEYSSWGIELFKIERLVYVLPWNFTETRYWFLFRVHRFKRIASFQTVIADFEIFGKWFNWKRKAEELPDELPF